LAYKNGLLSAAILLCKAAEAMQAKSRVKRNRYFQKKINRGLVINKSLDNIYTP
jgi:hypothetical protein